MRRLGSSLLISIILLAACGGSAFAQDARSDDLLSLSRVTLAAPVFTRHLSNDKYFNDDNWGGFAIYRFSDEWYVSGGDFTNSYNKNTVFAAVSWLPLRLDADWLRVDAGVMVGVDLNGGYKHYNPVDPMLGAFNIKFSGHDTDPQADLLTHLGLLLTVIPGVGSGTSTALNMAVTVQL